MTMTRLRRFNRWTEAAPLKRAAAGLAAFLLVAGPIVGQAEPDRRRGAVVERVEVKVVNVEAWVTDKQGRPVTGLTADDFEVREDGKPVEVTYFSELRSGTAWPGSALTVAPGADESPPAEEAEAPASTLGSLVIYFDELHLAGANRKRLLEDLESFVDSSGIPAERILILRQDTGLYTEASLGSTRDELRQALERLAKPTPVGVQVGADKRQVVQRLLELWQETEISPGRRDPCIHFVRRAQMEVLARAREGRSWIAYTVEHLTTTASFLAGVPGVKALLYVSGGLDMNPGADLQVLVNDLCPVADREPGSGNELSFPPEELGTLFQDLTRHANANRVTIYSLQATGLQTGFLNSPEQATLPFRGRASTFDLAMRAAERSGLTHVAEQTGGRAILNRNRFASALEGVGRDLGNYYSLGYEPPHAGDGGTHRIEVRVRGSGLDVRYRQGYRDKTADETMRERVEGALYLGLMSNPLASRLGAGTLRPAEGRRFELPLHVMVPVERVVFLPSEKGSFASLHLQALVRDAGNLKVSSQDETYRVAQPPAGGPDTLDLVLSLELEEGVHVIAVGLRDETTGETSYLSTTVEVRQPSSDAPR